MEAKMKVMVCNRCGRIVVTSDCDRKDENGNPYYTYQCLNHDEDLTLIEVHEEEWPLCKVIFDLVQQSLPTNQIGAKHNLWVNSDNEIMCRSEEKANAIADLLEAIGWDIMHTSYYYDQKEDGTRYDWWAVYPD